MRKRRNVILGLAVASWVAIACSTGSGPITQLGDGYESPTYQGRENPGPGREIPPGSREGPPPSREIPPPTLENPGNLGGGAGGGGGGGGGGGSTCPPCDTKFDCTANGKKQSISLKTVKDECSAGEGVTFDCSGRVLQNGQPIGTWSGSGSNYTVTVSVQGQTQTLTCTKSQGTTTMPTGTSTGTAPTGTTTTTPPGGTKTCADLLACCNKIANATLKNSCTMTYNAIKTSEPTCASAYASYAPSCP